MSNKVILNRLDKCIDDASDAAMAIIKVRETLRHFVSQEIIDSLTKAEEKLDKIHNRLEKVWWDIEAK